MSDDSGFLSRWSRRKVQARQGMVEEPLPAAAESTAVPVAPTAAAVVVTPPATTTAPLQPDPAAAAAEPVDAKPPPPTMADVATLTRESDFSRFVAPNVDGEVKNAALKKLFSDPHFNVMDGLDTYIDDYSKPDPLPLASVRKMAQAAFLGLIQADPPTDKAATASPPTAQAPISAEVAAVPSEDTNEALATPEPDEDADLRLQPHDAAGRGSAEDSAAGHERHQS